MKRMRQSIFSSAGRLFEIFQGTHTENLYFNHSKPLKECLSSSSNESLITCAESFSGFNKSSTENERIDIPWPTPHMLQLQEGFSTNTMERPSISRTPSSIQGDFLQSLDVCVGYSYGTPTKSKFYLDGSDLIQVFSDKLELLIDDMLEVLEDPTRSINELPQIEQKKT